LQTKHQLTTQRTNVTNVTNVTNLTPRSANLTPIDDSDSRYVRVTKLTPGIECDPGRRKHVPADLKLVELFGYTLGGIYLARYEDSPAGTFDEMVALGGLVWNAPTSCAWWGCIQFTHSFKAPGFNQPLNLSRDFLVSKFALKCNLHRYSVGR
jgi:hypothetical protein